MSKKIKGIFLSTIVSVIIIFIFFGKIIQDPSIYYFSAKGDGFKAYYGAMYHLKYDTSSMRMNGMNYPYGEMVFFTGSQPLVVNTVKFISNNFVDISDNIVGIMNLLMIFSIVLAAIFMFLIFYELDVNWIYSAVVTVGICMLSPQIARFGGHFSLSWLFWIPLMIYLVIMFDKKPTFLKAGIIGIITFLAGGMHMYFFGFYGFIIGLYLLAQIVNKNHKFGWLKGILFFAVQYILPFLILQIIISLNDPVTDRTAFPYGFWAYLGHPAGVFLPSGKPYAFVPKVITVLKHVSWESLAFIGVTSLAGFFVGVFSFFRNITRKKNPLIVTDNFLLNTLFWSSFAALLFSFGIPFILGLESLVDKLGTLRQLRALARFSWFFFYMLNIVVFYNIYKKVTQNNTSLKWKIIGLAAFGFLFFDGYWNIYMNSRFIQNRKPEMEDTANLLPQNRWVNKINPNDYQAIIPLPYFHVGSENIWIESKNNMQEITMIASLKTGLATTATQLSRTSISQTYKNYALVTEPFEPLQILEDLPNEKPFLLLFNRKHYPNKDEERLIKAAKLIFQDENIELRKLPIYKLADLSKNYYSDIKTKFGNADLFNRNQYTTTDSVSIFVHKDFNESESEITYEGAGAIQYPAQHWENIFDETIKVKAGKKLKVSFWMYNYKQDGYLRTVIEVTQRNSETKELNNYFYSDAHRHIKGFQGDWALIEFDIETKDNDEQISIALRNSTLTNKTLIVDELLIREAGVDIYYPSNNIQMKNGRKLPFVLQP